MHTCFRNDRHLAVMFYGQHINSRYIQQHIHRIRIFSLGSPLQVFCRRTESPTCLISPSAILGGFFQSIDGVEHETGSARRNKANREKTFSVPVYVFCRTIHGPKSHAIIPSRKAIQRYTDGFSASWRYGEWDLLWCSAK